MTTLQTTAPTTAPTERSLLALTPMFFIVFISMQSVAVTLPALPIELNRILDFNDWIVGATMGIQALVTVALRHRAGSYCDKHGSKEAVCLGLVIAVVSSLAYLMAAAPIWAREAMLAWIILSRILLGIGEALFITGVMSWGISRVGEKKTGKVMTWQGIALYSAMGMGAPLGLYLQNDLGFVSVALVALVAPLIALLIAVTTQGVPAMGGHRASFFEVINLIWKPGVVLTLASVPFATMSAFLSLYYEYRGWFGDAVTLSAGPAMLGFGSGYVFVRLFFAHLPDRLGGVTVAVGSLAIEAVGQLLLWMSPTPLVAFIGATLTGIGFSLIFPSMGVEATRRMRSEQRGQAVGNFIAFFDISLGTTAPIVGIAIFYMGYDVCFSLGTMATVLALLLVPTITATKPVDA